MFTLFSDHTLICHQERDTQKICILLLCDHLQQMKTEYLGISLLWTNELIFKCNFLRFPRNVSQTSHQGCSLQESEHLRDLSSVL